MLGEEAQHRFDGLPGLLEPRHAHDVVMGQAFARSGTIVQQLMVDAQLAQLDTQFEAGGFEEVISARGHPDRRQTSIHDQLSEPFELRPLHTLNIARETRSQHLDKPTGILGEKATDQV